MSVSSLLMRTQSLDSGPTLLQGSLALTNYIYNDPYSQIRSQFQILGVRPFTYLSGDTFQPTTGSQLYHLIFDNIKNHLYFKNEYLGICTETWVLPTLIIPVLLERWPLSHFLGVLGCVCVRACVCAEPPCTHVRSLCTFFCFLYPTTCENLTSAHLDLPSSYCNAL